MKPLEVTNTGEGEMECELHSKEFFVQVGMLVIEGRIPQNSERGRIEGKHTYQGKSRHVCEDKDEECQEAKTWVQQIEYHWLNNQPIIIDVVVQLTEQTNTAILLEQWTVSIISNSNSPSTSGCQLLQAVRSHIHFSQLSAWLSLSKGSLPYTIEYRLNEGQGYFIQEPVLHKFPLASLPSQRSLQVIVKSLPRCSLQDLIKKHNTFGLDTADNEHPCDMNTIGNSEFCSSESSENGQSCSYKKRSENSQPERTNALGQCCSFKKTSDCNQQCSTDTQVKPSSSQQHSPDRSENGGLCSYEKLPHTSNQCSSERTYYLQPWSSKTTSDSNRQSSQAEVHYGQTYSNNKTLNQSEHFIHRPHSSDNEGSSTETFYGKACGSEGSASSPCSDTRSPLRKRTCLKEVTSGRTYISHSSLKLKQLSTLSKAQCSKQTCSLDQECLPLEKEDKLSVYSSTLGACCSNWESNGIGNLNERIEKLGKDVVKVEKEISGSDKRFSGLSMLLKESRITSTRHFGISKDSVVKNDGLDQSRDSKLWTNKDMTKMFLQRKYRSLSEQDASLRNGVAAQLYKQTNPGEPRISRHSPTRHGTLCNSSDVDIHAIKQPVDKACFRRSVQLPISTCTEPVFNPKTGLPVSSSPAPLRRSTNELYEDDTDFSDGLSSKVNYRELSKLLSRSAPASTTQSLLVNFEESVLNGRMEPVGTVEGFTAELSASGSFCPRHVKLPIISCFYRLSDDDAPSPYMGYISLKDEPLGRRGYHVPRKGTIQLTVFNPNKTVVKMFVVLYDCSDMPPKSQTFLRQKTYSALKGNVVKNEAQQTLHYLLHLRFASSKSGKIYLHTDIRVIFARQPPDLGHIYQLYTNTDGPTDPKYTRRYHTSMDPEC